MCFSIRDLEGSRLPGGRWRRKKNRFLRCFPAGNVGVKCWYSPKFLPEQPCGSHCLNVVGNRLFLRAGKWPCQGSSALDFSTKLYPDLLELHGVGRKKDGKELKLWKINPGWFHQQLKSAHWKFFHVNNPIILDFCINLVLIFCVTAPCLLQLNNSKANPNNTQFFQPRKPSF